MCSDADDIPDDVPGDVPGDVPDGVPGAWRGAAGRWRERLGAWRIPEEILAVAPQSPWPHPVDQFTVAERIPDSASHRRARQALQDPGPGRANGVGGPSVLDLGCGGGRAALAVAPPAQHLIGVDSSAAMLAAFAAAAGRRGVAHTEIEGSWPEVADRTPAADVVLAHHVAYNVVDLAGFALAATAHARRRVVLELPWRHPLAPLAPLWKHFWDLDRPDGPTAEDAREVLVEAGLDARLERWTEPGEHTPGRAPLAPGRRVELTRIRLCLPADRDDEVAEAMQRVRPIGPREVAAIWWDVA